VPPAPIAEANRKDFVISGMNGTNGMSGMSGMNKINEINEMNKMDGMNRISFSHRYQRHSPDSQ
jgi:hypothetical protein